MTAETVRRGGEPEESSSRATERDFSRYQDLTARWTVEGNDGWRLDEEAAPCARWWETVIPSRAARPEMSIALTLY